MLRVLHVIGAMDRAGAETFIMNVFRAINRDKIQFDFLVHTERECDYDAEIRSLGGKIYSVPRFTGKNYFEYHKAIVRFFWEHPEHTIVHGHIGSCAAIYLSEAKKCGKYTIAHSHSTYGALSPSGLVLKALSLPTRHTADYFLACSLEAGESRFGKSIVADKEHFSVVNNGIELDGFAGMPEMRKVQKAKLGLEDSVVLGHVGRFEYPKNQGFVVDILAALKKENPQAKLIFVGSGSQRSEVENKIKACGLENDILFAGSVEDVRPWLNAMDVFVFPSFFEGLPFAVIEAQAAGLPCVVTDAIAQSVFVTEFIESLSVKEPAQKWAQVCISAAQNREVASSGNIERLRVAGFDINDTVRFLEDLYCSKR